MAKLQSLALHEIDCDHTCRSERSKLNAAQAVPIAARAMPELARVIDSDEFSEAAERSQRIAPRESRVFSWFSRPRLAWELRLHAEACRASQSSYHLVLLVGGITSSSKILCCTTAAKCLASAREFSVSIVSTTITNCKCLAQVGSKYYCMFRSKLTHRSVHNAARTGKNRQNAKVPRSGQTALIEDQIAVSSIE